MNLADFFAKSQTPRLSGGSNEPQNEPLNGPLNETLNLLSVPVKTVYDAIKTNPRIRRAGIVAILADNSTEHKIGMLKFVLNGTEKKFRASRWSGIPCLHSSPKRTRSPSTEPEH